MPRKRPIPRGCAAARALHFAWRTIQDLATLTSIDAAFLMTVSGGGPSMGDRENPRAPDLPRGPSAGSSEFWGGIDAGMEKAPANPQMDMGMSKLPPTMTPGGFSDGFNGAARSGPMDIC